MDPSLSVVVPCYNEAENIPVVFPPLLEFAKERGWRVIAVDDGSRDETRALLLKMKEGAPHLDVVCHKLNRGYGAATKTGLRAVKTEYAITIDADGQHRLEDVEKCYRRIVETDADLVVGERVNNESGGYRSLGKWVIRTFASLLLSLPVRDLNSGMKCYRMSEAVSYLDLCPDTMAFSDVILLLMVNVRKLVSRTEIEVAPRLAGKSTIGTRTALVTMAEILNLAILLRPMTTFCRIALTFAIPGLAWGVFIYCKSRTITSASVMMILLGAVSFILGLLGEQLAQIRKSLAKQNNGR